MRWEVGGYGVIGYAGAGERQKIYRLLQSPVGAA